MPRASMKQSENTLPTVALVGRVNVGKSTLFNRLIEEQKALVSDIPGTTRTNNIGKILWKGRYIRLIDTGGLKFEETLPLEEAIIRQTAWALEKADIIIFVTDATTGIIPEERELAKRLREAKKPVILVANKVDKTSQEANLHSREYQSLGFGSPIPVSGANGRNVGDFLDHFYTILQKGNRRPKIATT